MDEQTERRLRRKAVKWHQQGKPISAIANRIKRSRRWVHKWVKRARETGRRWARSQSRRRHHPGGYSKTAKKAVIRARQQLSKAGAGCHGARAISVWLNHTAQMEQAPSASTVQRMLHEAELIGATAKSDVARPCVLVRSDYVLHEMDWTERYLPNGTKMYAFHTLDVATRGLHQTLSTDKTGQTVRQHGLEAWERQGLPHGLQMDNDAAFCGGYKVPRVFGGFVRLCLYVGVEPIFTPLAEPEFNGAVEFVNGLWSHRFWNRHHFNFPCDVRRLRPRFLDWYTHDYFPPAVQPHTVAECMALHPRLTLTAAHVSALPLHDQLPITTGHVHFMRHIDQYGDISLLNETWHVHKHWAGHYAFATVSTRQQRLYIYLVRSSLPCLQLLKQLDYPLDEPVLPLSPQFRRPHPHLKVRTM